MSLGSEHLRHISELLLELIGRVPVEVDRRSPRWAESKMLRSTPNLGRARASQLDAISVDVSLMGGYSALLLSGVADCFQVAESRDDEVNVPSLNAAVRPLLEVAGQVAWLLDDTADPIERVRRHLRWRFADLRAQRLLLVDLDGSHEAADGAAAELDREEAELLQIVGACGWQGRATTSSKPGTLDAAGLHDEQGNKLGIPKLTDLVGRVSRSPYVYGLLSVPTHGARWGVVGGLRDPADGRSGVVDMVGTGLDPNLALGLAVVSVDNAGKHLAGWNRVDGGRLHREAKALCARAGIR